MALEVTSKSQWASFIEPAPLRTSQRALEWFSHFFHRHRCIFLRRDARSIEAHKKRDSLCRSVRVDECVREEERERERGRELLSNSNTLSNFSKSFSSEGNH